MKILKLFLTTILFILLSGLSAQLGAVPATFAFGICALLCFAGCFLLYLEGGCGR